jgi:heparosan-N-sulfate-glucuronate 5-epimerase
MCSTRAKLPARSAAAVVALLLALAFSAPAQAEDTTVRYFGAPFPGIVEADGDLLINTDVVEAPDVKTVKMATEYRIEPDAPAWSPVVTSYDPTGPYLHQHRGSVLGRSGVSTDANGIPMVTYKFGGPFYYPTTIAQYGLEQFSKWKLGTAPDGLAIAVQQGEWLLANQDAAGGWPIPFDYTWDAKRVSKLNAGWYSAMGSGQAISLFVRLHSATGEQRWVAAVHRAIPLMAAPQETGGLNGLVLGRRMLQEYPTDPPAAVFNGWLFAVIGVYDATTVAAPEAQALFDQQVGTLRDLLPLFDLGNRTVYDLSHVHQPSFEPNVARWAYHRTNLTTLAAISEVTGDAHATAVARWDGYLRAQVVPPN